MELTDTSRMVLVRADAFMDLPTEHLAIIRRFLEEHHFAAGWTLFREGDESDRLYVVRRGSVKIQRVRDGALHQIGRRGPGEMIGETALIGSSRRGATVVCETHSDFFVLTRSAFDTILSNYPDIAARVLRALATRIRDLDAARVQELEDENRTLDTERDRLTSRLHELESTHDRLDEALSYRDDVLAAFPDPVIVTDTSNCVHLVNPAALRLFGESNWCVLWEWIKPVELETVVAVEEALRRGVAWSGDLEVFGLSGRVLLCRVAAVPIPRVGAGEAARLWILEDRTEIRASQQETLQRERLATKAGMAAEIAHDFNNFLAVLSGNAELLELHLGPGSAEKTGRYVSNIRQSLERMQVLLENLLHFRCPSGQKTATEFHAFVENLVAFLRLQKEFKKIIIKTDWGSDVPSVICDRSAIQQVLYNLLLNAAEALAETSGTVWIEACFVRAMGVVRLRVADDGPGMAAVPTDSIFKRRVSTKSAERGFGLMTCARLMRDHGGTITAGSRSGGGAEFTLDLPVGSTEPETPGLTST